MSAFVASWTHEHQLNDIVREYLEFAGYDSSASTFARECAEKGKPIPSGGAISTKDGSVLNTRTANGQIQREVVQAFQLGQRERFFDLWQSHIADSIRNEDQVARKLEFYLYLYFAIFPIKNKTPDSEKHMVAYRSYLETRGSQLSQTTEFLPFYALPYVPDPVVHPSFKDLFEEHWSPDLQLRLERFLALALETPKLSRLQELFQNSMSLQNTASTDVRDLQLKIVEAEKRTMQYMRHHNKVQSDYHNLIGITAELVDTLEATLRGTPVSVEYLQHICKRLFHTQRLGTALDLSRPGTAAKALRQSILPSTTATTELVDATEKRSIPSKSATLSQEIEARALIPLNFNNINNDLQKADGITKAYLLQALRWRLTQSSPEIREGQLNTFLSADILGCSSSNSRQREAIFACFKAESKDVVLAEYTARLFNTVASLCKGRSYLSSDSDILTNLVEAVKVQHKQNATREHLVGCLQKLSLRRPMQTLMIEQGLVEWLIESLQEHDELSDYMLEYTVALLMNLCLRGAGKRRCAVNSQKVLRTLSDLLGHENQEILPYVNGALYSILALPEIRHTARTMDMEGILKCFIKEGQSDMNRQIEFIIRQLNAEEEPDSAESDYEDDDDEEEADSLEPDLDKDELLVVVSEQGEALLRAKYGGTYSAQSAHKSRTVSKAQELLTRPVTPGQRRTPTQLQLAVNKKHTDSGALQGGLNPATERTDRPPTRSGSRPNTGQNGLNPKLVEAQAFQTKPRINRTPDTTGSGNAPKPTYSQNLPSSRPNSSEKPKSSHGARSGQVKSDRKH